jgi:[ribosomal protein S18]-alanine N-acetyltransferase
MHSISIIPAGENRINDLYRIELLCHVHPWSLSVFTKEFNHPGSFHYLLTTSAGIIIGFVLSLIIVDELHIHNIAIHPDFQRKGYAKILVSTILSYAESKKVVSVFLEVRENNIAALRLYKNLGFTSISRRDKYYSDNETAIIMKKDL